MKREKDEKMIMGPMFPRLHVNDTDKGGPRAPPRNKMALYEQLSIPSNRLSGSIRPSSQEIANERDMFLSRHQSEKQYTQYSDMTAPLTQVEHGKKLEEDDFTVPIFVHSIPNQEWGELTDALNGRKRPSSNPSNFDHRLNSQKPKKMDALESSVKQEAKCQKEENSQEVVKKQIDSTANFTGRLNSNDNVVEPELCGEYKPDSKSCNTSVVDENVAELEERDEITNQNILHDISNSEKEFRDGPCQSQRMRNLDGVNGVSENSVVDSIRRVHITPDDVVGIIGHKRFWKARNEIVNQQRIFAVQVFELHRLIRVQRLIAASPHILLEDSSPYLGKRITPSTGKRKPLDYPIYETPHISKQKDEPEKPSHNNESFTEKVSLPFTAPRPVSSNSPAPSVSSNYNPGPWCFNPPLGNQWLIPMMSPSEGLVYKPYPGPAGYAGQTFGGCGPPGLGPLMGNFPAPHPQYQFSSFLPAGPHGYIPPYGMANPISGLPAKPTNGPLFLNPISARDPNMCAIPGNNNRASPNVLDNLNPSEDIEAQASIASSPVGDLHDNNNNNGESKSTEGRNVLPLFPTSPPVDGPKSSPRHSVPERPTRVIKVVPHNAMSASESAARIFQSIQEERRRHDLV